MKAYASLALNILRSNAGRLPFPYKLTFVVTYWCQYKCKTCNIWQRRPKNELTLDEIQRFFEKSNGFNWIDFTGGEPWLRKDFPEVVGAAIEHCKNLVLIHFPTNGYMSDTIIRGVERILRKRPRKLIVTISTDGDESVNDYVRGIKGGWRKQMETYKRLHAMRGVKVVLGMTLSALNVDQYEVAFAAAKAECPWLEPRDFHVNIVHESGHYYGNADSKPRGDKSAELLEHVEHYRALRGLPRGVVDMLEWQYLRQVKRYLAAGRTPMKCHALRSSCFVDSWGDVYPCGMYDAKIASLREYDFDLRRIWALERTKTLQTEIWDYKCPQCWTPCEAYQSIFGNLLGLRSTRAKPRAVSAAAAAAKDESVELPVIRSESLEVQHSQVGGDRAK